MKKIQYDRYGDSGVLRLEGVDRVDPGKGQIRVIVKAASANPVDWKILAGTLKMMTGSKFPRGIGMDFAGVVDAVGAGVKRFQVGDEVFGAMGMKDAGSFAESIITTEHSAALKPTTVSFEHAATLPIAGGAAWTALVTTAHVKAGQSVFVNGCLGSVGRASVQLSRMFGAEVTGTCNATGLEEAHALGVTKAFDYHSFDPGQLKGQFDIVLDTSGTLSLKQCAAMLKSSGIALHINNTPGKLFRILFAWRNKAVFVKTPPEVLIAIGDAAAKGELVIAIGQTVSLADALQAIKKLEMTKSPKGKLVIASV